MSASERTFEVPTAACEPKRANSAGTFSGTRCGLVMVDASLRPLYLNSEAARILDLNVRSIADSLHKRLVEVCRGHSVHEPFVQEVRSRHRRYICRAFPLDAAALVDSAHEPALVLFFERSTITGADIEFVSRTFRLTAREQVALAFLTTGLTSKDIATRMKVSPNTVKAFLRAVMSKMGVATRTELMKIFLDHAYIAHRSTPSWSEQEFMDGLKEAGLPLLARAANL